jgi:hypothetical protein
MQKQFPWKNFPEERGIVLPYGESFNSGERETLFPPVPLDRFAALTCVDRGNTGGAGTGWGWGKVRTLRRAPTATLRREVLKMSSREGRPEEVSSKGKYGSCMCIIYIYIYINHI